MVWLCLWPLVHLEVQTSVIFFSGSKKGLQLFVADSEVESRRFNAGPVKVGRCLLELPARVPR